MSSFWEFVKRHRGKIVFGAVLAGGVYVGQKLLSRAAESTHPPSLAFSAQHHLGLGAGDFPTDAALLGEVCDPETRKIYIFTSNQKACENTILQIVPTVSDNLQTRFDIEKLLESLKSGDADKIMVFEAVKVMSFSRLFSATYVYSLLIIGLKVQISIVAGDIYAQNFPAARRNFSAASMLGGNLHDWRQFVHQWFNKKSAVGSASSQQIFLQALQYFLTQGCHNLADKIDKIVRSVINDIPLKQHVTFDQLQRLMFEIRAKVDSIRNYSQFVVPMLKDHSRGDMADSSVLSMTSSFGDEKLSKMLLNFKQALESRQFSDVLRTFVDEFLSKSAEFIRSNRSEWSVTTNQNDVPSTSAVSEENTANSSADENLHIPAYNTNTVALPLAKILPTLSDSFAFISKTEQRSVINRLLNSISVADFCLDIFENSLSMTS